MSEVRIEVALPSDVIESIIAAVTEQVLDMLADEATPSPFVTAAGAAALLACARQRIYDLASAGRLPRFREGGRTLYRRTDVLALVEPERRK